MKKFLVLCVLFVGCTSKSPGCDVAKAVSGGIASVVASQLSCSNVGAITNDIIATLPKNLCETSATSVIGDIVCPTIVDSLLAGALSKIPASWGCTGGGVKDGLKDQLLTACKKAI